MVEAVSSPIADFYKEKSILVTGVTGFVGKVLVEKLLRSCPQIKTIYLLLRPKKGQDPKQRLENVFKTKISERLEKEQPGCTSKLIPIDGDLTLPGLGISDSDKSLLIDNVSIVFHSAASVNMNDTLKRSLELNLLGTQRLLELCHKMTHLEALIHLSTAYCNSNREEIDEIVYDLSVPAQRILDIVQWMDENTMNILTPQLMEGRPNTYTYGKAVTESFLVEERGDLPIAIVRPSIVTGSWKEPYPGWVDSVNGPAGLVASISKGLLQYMSGKQSCAADIIPVDVVINLTITVAWYTATNRPNKPLVYNCCSGDTNRVTWGEFVRVLNGYMQRNPSSGIFFYPTFQFIDSHLLKHFRVLLYHYLPAYALDLIALVTGRKPRLVSIYQRIHKSVHTLEHFTTHEWSFSTQNVQMLLEKVTPEDKQVFNFDIKALSWPTYLEDYFLGIRQFILKDDLSTLPVARRSLKRRYIFRKATHLILLFLVWKLVVMLY